MKKKRTTKTDTAPVPAGDPMLEQIRRAWIQLDREPGGALGWLVNTFTREEASGWLPGEAEAHACRLLALIYGRKPPGLLWLADRIDVAEVDAMSAEDRMAVLERAIAPIPPLSTADVVQLHGELGGFLRALVSAPVGASVRVPTEGLQVALMHMTSPGKKPAIFAKTNPGGPRRTILFQVVADLIAPHDRLVACKQCGDPMLALRKAVFCQPSCLQKWHDARRDKTGRRPPVRPLIGDERPGLRPGRALRGGR